MEPLKLKEGVRYRVKDILHEYLGQARLPHGSDLVHVFLRSEWRPETQGQPLITLVEGAEVDQLVTKTGRGGLGAHRYRRMREGWE